MFWGKKDTSITFSESKYKVLFWIYEFYNTISSGFYFAALIPLIKKKKKNYKLLGSITGIGVGSLILHGTGRYYGQWLDEFSMLKFVQFILEDLDDNHPKILRYFLLTYFIFWRRFIYFLFVFTAYNLRIFYLMRKKTNFLLISSLSSMVWLLEQQNIKLLKK